MNMKTKHHPLRTILLSLLILLLLVLVVFVGFYFTRLQTIQSIEQITDYDDSYNLYRMNVQYDYSLDRVIAYGITDNQTMLDAILKEALPLLPVNMKVPNYGCTAFTLTDTDGSVIWGATMISSEIRPRCWYTVRQRMAIGLSPLLRWIM